MRVFHKIEELRQFLAQKRNENKSIGFVPTMGALHEGHLSLISQSTRSNDLTVVSIFVNPVQFNNEDDYNKYPKSPDSDIKYLEKSMVDVIFLPSRAEMYPTSERLSFDFGKLGQVMEGKFRPGHFSGVALVVSKLFNIVSPDRAYFGQKDFQQYLIVEELNSSLKFDIELVRVPTERDRNGLALSSRNARLSEDEKVIASQLNLHLEKAKEDLRKGQSIADVTANSVRALAQSGGIELEYFEIVDSKTLTEPNESSDQLVLCIAGYVNGIRLIDNTLLNLPRH